MNTADMMDMGDWVDLINQSYNEQTPRDIGAAKRHIEDHLFLDILKIYFVLDGDTPIATISIGTYRGNPRIGGEARIAVRANYQGRGLGRFVICYGCERLRDYGVQFCENIVSVKRQKSIMLHYQCGFVPQLRSNYQQHVNQRRFFIAKLIAVLKIVRYYRLHQARFSRNFLVG
jgi:GNAT superfamily N-acetyltransferase